ncbi:serine/threonine-protein kinase [Nocardia sp. NPDC059240]|uniref:serine/threonine-protein kinase n=1 Tax=Nocardia sp. NPDC059240 TaxID=3346786 RepID=UPI003693A6CF
MKPLTPRDPRWLGRNRMIAVIGRGGMGRVLLGRTPSGKLVAVKLVHPHLAEDPDFRERFRREVAAGRQLTGAYTAAVVDSDADAESPWLATEYFPAPDLRTVLAECGPLHLGGLKLLATGLAAALLEIHRAGLVHRDLAPGNVLLTEEGPRIIDFGIARALDGDGELTVTGTAVGSPAFMAPEQAEGAPATAAADLFSVGAILTLAATGETPFPGTSTPQILYHVMHSQPETGGVPPSLREVVNACLARDPAQRPTARQLLEAAGAIAAEPVWPESVRTTIGAHRADSDWWVSSAEREADYRDQLERIRIRRRDRLRRLAAGVAAVVFVAATALAAGSWAQQPGHPQPIADPVVTATSAELRQLDGCALMVKALGDRFGTQSRDAESHGQPDCEIYYTKDNHRRRFNLLVGISAKEELETKVPTGRTVAWAPILAQQRLVFPDICDSGVIIPNSEQDGLLMTAQTTDGDDIAGNDLCALSEQALVAVVQQLTRYVPQRQLPENSIRRLDPCAVLDPALSRSIAGDPARLTPSLDMCIVDGTDHSFLLRLDEESRPDLSFSNGADPRQIGTYTVYRTTTAENPAYCAVRWIARLTTGDHAEVAEISVNSWTAATDACDRAEQLAADILPRLAKS